MLETESCPEKTIGPFLPCLSNDLSHDPKKQALKESQKKEL